MKEKKTFKSKLKIGFQKSAAALKEKRKKEMKERK